MKYYIIMSVALLLQGCNWNSTEEYSAKFSQTSEDELTIVQHNNGKELIEKYCYSCHQTNATMEDRIAPPMFAVKNHYLNLGDTKEEFTDAILAWVEDPSEENSRMPGALQKFGVMPYQVFPKDTIVQIAHYLYDNEIQRPGGYRGQGRGRKGRGQ